MRIPPCGGPRGEEDQRRGAAGAPPERPSTFPLGHQEQPHHQSGLSERRKRQMPTAEEDAVQNLGFLIRSWSEVPIAETAEEQLMIRQGRGNLKEPDNGIVPASE